MVSFLLRGCDPERNVRGRVIPPEDLVQVQKGVVRLGKAQVEELIGPAPFVLSFDENTWYYFNLFTETNAFFSPSIKKIKDLLYCLVLMESLQNIFLILVQNLWTLP